MRRSDKGVLRMGSCTAWAGYDCEVGLDLSYWLTDEYILEIISDRVLVSWGCLELDVGSPKSVSEPWV